MKFSTIPALSIMLSAVLMSAIWPLPALAAPSSPSRTGMAELGDPYIPPRVKAHARAMGIMPMTTGATLQSQALGKLRKKFNEADTDHRGQISRQQAQRSGFGYVADHFDAIDRQHRGSISFDELKAFLRANGAAL
jgi:hypothetical protein